jgi:hypothetical protein
LGSGCDENPRENKNASQSLQFRQGSDQARGRGEISLNRVIQVTRQCPVPGSIIDQGALNREEEMHKIWFGVAFAALISHPAAAQDYHKNFRECAKEFGLYPDTSYTHKLQADAGGRTLRRWYFRGEAQRLAFEDCLVRRSKLAPQPPAKGTQRVSR